MNLDEFIKLTLSQIVNGVDDASRESKGKIAPEIGMGDEDPKILRTMDDNRGVFLIEFDIALVASDKSEGGGSAEVSVYVVTAKGEKSKTTESSSIHRVKFSVPVSYGPSRAA